MLVKSLGSSGSVAVVALALTPELTTAMALVVAAVFVGLVNLYTARTSRLVALKEIAKQLAPVEQKVSELIPIVAGINAHVNSEKTRAEGESATDKAKIALQREMIEELKAAAALLAQAKATSDISTAVAQAAIAGATTPATAAALAPVAAAPSSVPEVAPVLAQIEANTDATAKNTAKTDATVTALKDDAQ